MPKENAPLFAKKQLRAVMKERRAALSPTERATQSAQVSALLRDFWQSNHFDGALVYVGLSTEVDIADFTSWLLAQDVPVWAPYKNDFGPVRYSTDLRPRRKSDFPTGPIAIFIPGLAFDLQGGRLGFGGGWYDRALARFPQAVKVGVAFECQIVPEVPHEAHDVKMDWVVTSVASVPVAGMPVEDEEKA